MIDIYTIDNELICSDHRGDRKPFLRRSGDYTLLEDEGHEYAKEIEYKVFVKKSMNKDTLFYGLGERTGSLNKRGYYYFSAVDGNIDYYFINGPQIKEVVEMYTYLTGRTPLPAIWTLGYAQSRWTYANEERVMEIADSFREKGIPCDTIYLDIVYLE